MTLAWKSTTQGTVNIMGMYTIPKQTVLRAMLRTVTDSMTHSDNFHDAKSSRNDGNQ